MVAATMVTKKGGTLLMYAGGIKGGRFPESLLEAFDVAFPAAGRGHEATRHRLPERRQVRCPQRPDGFQFRSQHGPACSEADQNLLISPDTDEEQARRLGFDYVPSLQQAIDMIARRPKQATVNILPSGGLVLPLLADGIRFSW